MIELNGAVSNYVQLSGKRYSFFSGNNYLGLANHPEIKKAAKKSIDHYGLNFAAARQTTGTAVIHLELEKELSAFKNREDTVVFASGYMGNSILLHALKDRYTDVFADEACHPSILDGIPRDCRQIHVYRHLDAGHLETLLQRHKDRQALIITDGIFALTGDISPIDQLYLLAEKHKALLVIDDAHATGVLGENGRGTPEYFQLHDAPGIFQTETMSKAIGVYGGYISASKAIIGRIREGSRAYLASTSLPPPLVSAACTAVQLMIRQPRLRTRLFQKARKIREGIIKLGFSTSEGPAPIIPVFFKSLEKARNLSGYLKENGIIVPCISYPVHMKNFAARITVSVNHTPGQIEELFIRLKQWRSKHGVT